MITTPSLRAVRFVTRFPVFYGWVVLVVATVGMILPFAGHNTTIALFIDDFIAEFNLDRTAIATLLGVGGFMAALAYPFIGRLIDRYGNRLVILVGGGLFGLSLVALSLAASPLALFVLFIAMRGIGMGPMWMTSSTVLAQWFRSRRGQVMGITVVFTWLSQSLYVPWVQQLLETYTWQQFWMGAGIVIGVLIAPLMWLLVRDRPELYGLQPDGGALVPQTEVEARASAEESWTLREARRTPLFWIFAVGRSLLPALGSSLMLHQISLFSALGHEPQVAAQTFSLVSITAAVSSILAGYLTDRLRPGLMMLLQLITMSLTILLAMTMTATWMLPLYALAFGSSISLGAVFDNSVWANLFGRDHLGEIRGWVATFTAVGVGAGPVLFGWSYDVLGSYNPMFGVFLVLFVIQMILAVVAPRPTRSAPVMP
jgi:MFS family permease